MLIDYNRDDFAELEVLEPAELSVHLDTESVSWVDLGVWGDKSVLTQLATVFNLHPLILEDIVNVPQRPKIEDRQEQLVVITQMANL